MAGEMTKQIRAAALGPPERGRPQSEAFLKSAGIWRRSYCLGQDFVGFQGHFEGHPVLPALAQVLIAQDLAQALSPTPLRLEAVGQAKFLSLIRPGQALAAYALPPADGGPGEWRIQLNSAEAEGRAETEAAFLRLKFAEAGHGL